jgi:hypothetical protein
MQRLIINKIQIFQNFPKDQKKKSKFFAPKIAYKTHLRDGQSRMSQSHDSPGHYDQFETKIDLHKPRFPFARESQRSHIIFNEI